MSGLLILFLVWQTSALALSAKNGCFPIEILAFRSPSESDFPCLLVFANGVYHPRTIQLARGT